MARSHDDLTSLSDMVDALVDDGGAGQPLEEQTNWSFASAPARVDRHSIALPAGITNQSSTSYVRAAHVPPSLPPGVLAIPLEQCFFATPRVKTPQPDNAASLVKLFIGNMRFEMTREALRWVLFRSCGVDVPITHVLVHVKAAANNSQPTGCASVYVNESDAEKLVEMNQRIFCSATTLYVAPTSAIMSKMIEDRQILDIDSRGKKLRGPKNSMVVELSRGGPTPSSTPTGSFSDVQYNPPSFASAGGTDSPVFPGSFSSNPYTSPPNGRLEQVSPPATPPLPLDSPSYERFPQQLQPHASTLQPPQPNIADPVELFVGGIRYEATRAFVAWMLTRALARRGYTATVVTEGHVKLFPGAQKRRSNNAGCAIVRLEREDAEKLQQLNHCVLCDAYGAYFGPTSEAMSRFISAYHDKMRGGPSHAVVIEQRKSSAPAPAATGQFSVSSGFAPRTPPPVLPPFLVGESRSPPMPSWMAAAQMQAQQFRATEGPSL